MSQLLKSLGFGTNLSSVLIAIATFVVLYLLQIPNWLGISFSVIVGLLAGVIIGQSPNTTPLTRISPRRGSRTVHRPALRPS